MALRKTTKKIKREAFIATKSVKTLKGDMFDHYLSERDVALVMFYDPRGAASQLTKPHFVKAALTLKQPNVVFGAVNCIEQGKLCKAQDILDLPTINLYSRGRFVKKQNPMRNYQEIVKAVESVPPAPPKVATKATYAR